jgi:hypothetical protein
MRVALGSFIQEKIEKLKSTANVLMSLTNELRVNWKAMAGGILWHQSASHLNKLCH